MERSSRRSTPTISRRSSFERASSMVRRLAEVDKLIDLTAPQTRFRGFGALRRKQHRPEYNVVHALNPGLDGQGEPYAAQLEARGRWQLDGEQLVLEVSVTNTGFASWPPAQWYPFPHGLATLAPYVPGSRR